MKYLKNPETNDYSNSLSPTMMYDIAKTQGEII